VGNITNPNAAIVGFLKENQVKEEVGAVGRSG